MDKIPAPSDDDNSEDEKPDFRYGIRHKTAPNDSDEDGPSTKKSLNDLD